MSSSETRLHTRSRPGNGNTSGRRHHSSIRCILQPPSLLSSSHILIHSRDGRRRPALYPSAAGRCPYLSPLRPVHATTGRAAPATRFDPSCRRRDLQPNVRAGHGAVPAAAERSPRAQAHPHVDVSVHQRVRPRTQLPLTCQPPQTAQCQPPAGASTGAYEPKRGARAQCYE